MYPWNHQISMSLYAGVANLFNTGDEGGLMFAAAFLDNRAPHSMFDVQFAYKIPTGTHPDLRLL